MNGTTLTLGLVGALAAASALTRRGSLNLAMVDAGKVLQIPLLDHVIITPTDQFSFKAYGLM